MFLGGLIANLEDEQFDKLLELPECPRPPRPCPKPPSYQKPSSDDVHGRPRRARASSGAGCGDRAEPVADPDPAVRAAGGVGRRACSSPRPTWTSIYRETVDARPREAWRGCVDAERLEAFVAGASPDGDVALRADDEGRLTIRCGRASCRLPTLPAEDFPLFTRPNEGAVELDLRCRSVCRRAARRGAGDERRRQETRYYLCGAFLQAGRLVATDGHRLTLHTVAADMPPAPDVIVPGPTVTRLLSLLRGLEGPISVTVSPTQIIVGTSSWTLTSKVIDGTFPDYRSPVARALASPLLVRRAALRSAAALVAKVERGDRVRGLRLATAGRRAPGGELGRRSPAACEVTIPLEGEPPAPAAPGGAQPPLSPAGAGRDHRRAGRAPHRRPGEPGMGLRRRRGSRRLGHHADARLMPMTPVPCKSPGRRLRP